MLRLSVKVQPCMKLISIAQTLAGPWPSGMQHWRKIMLNNNDKPTWDLTDFAPDTQDVAIRNAIVFQLAYYALHHVIEARTQPTARHDCAVDSFGVMIDGLSSSRSDSPRRERHANLQTALGKKGTTPRGCHIQALCMQRLQALQGLNKCKHTA